ncbi:MAG: hypothetical protein WCZ72_05490 [Gemmobacter sp.]
MPAAAEAAAEYEALFSALRDARDAYGNLRRMGRRLSDRELARDENYHRFHQCGMRIAYIGGEAAILGAIRAMSSEGADEDDLQRYWAGMGTWTH